MNTRSPPRPYFLLVIVALLVLAIAPPMLRQLGTNDLSFQYNQLLTQQHVFCDQLRLASRQVRYRTHDLIAFGWLGPALES